MLVYEVDSIEKSDIVVRAVSARNAADLLVCKATVRGAAAGRDDVWCFVDNYLKGKSHRVYFTDKSEEAELTICYVPHRGAAGWIKIHELQDQLG